MSTFPSITGLRLIKGLKKHGFEQIRSKGSHRFLRHPDGRCTVVPVHNIAEGYGRFHYLDNAKFCSISRGSCWEVLDHLITAHDEGILSDELLSEGRKHVSEAIKILNGYMKYLKTAASKTNK